MAFSPYRVVLDTNVVLRGLLNMSSASGRILDACDRRRVVVLLSKPLLAEYRAVLTDLHIVARYPELTVKTVDIALRRLRYVGDTLRSINVRFQLERDPKDEMLIELALSGHATHLISYDRDILSLRTGHGDAARHLRQRLPRFQIAYPSDFLRDHHFELGIDWS